METEPVPRGHKTHKTKLCWILVRFSTSDEQTTLAVFGSISSPRLVFSISTFPSPQLFRSPTTAVTAVSALTLSSSGDKSGSADPPRISVGATPSITWPPELLPGLSDSADGVLGAGGERLWGGGAGLGDGGKGGLPAPSGEGMPVDVKAGDRAREALIGVWTPAQGVGTL